MFAKMKGWRREDQCRKSLEAQGYDVFRSGGSLGVWDIIAIGQGNVRLVQVKSNRPPPPDERKRMRDYKCPKLVRKELWVYKDGQKKPIMEDYNEKK